MSFYKYFAKVKRDDYTPFTLFSVRTTIFTGNILFPELYGIFLPAFRTCSYAQSESVPQIREQMEFGIKT